MVGVEEIWLVDKEKLQVWLCWNEALDMWNPKGITPSSHKW